MTTPSPVNPKSWSPIGSPIVAHARGRRARGCLFTPHYTRTQYRRFNVSSGVNGGPESFGTRKRKSVIESD